MASAPSPSRLPLSNPRTPTPGGTSTIDDYEIIGSQPMGVGKFSVVWKAKHRVTGEYVALKMVRIFEMNSDIRKDCLHEAQLLFHVSHPNIIKCHETFVDNRNNELVIALELADCDLSSLIADCKGTPMDEKLIWHYFVQICEGIAHMHEKRIMHRDIKPGNVFITEGNTVKIGDLGLGRYFSSKTEEAKSLVGTPYFMSPEVLQEKGYTFKSDVWSLGCVLYELAMLKSPFFEKELTFYSLGKKIIHAEYPPIPKGAFSDSLRELVGKMIRSDPNERPDAAQVVQMAKRAVMELALEE